MHSRFQITEYCHHFLKEYIQENDCCVDATAGNGNDTEDEYGRIEIRAGRCRPAYSLCE